MFTYYLDLARRSFNRNRALTLLMVIAIAFGVGASMTTLTVLHVLAADPIPEASHVLYAVQVDPVKAAGAVPGAEPPKQMTLADSTALLRAAKADRQAMMSEQVHYEDVDTGDAVPVLTVTVDETQMFFFSAATYNGHRIHYDKEWARDVEGYDDVLVQGPLQAALLSRALTDWIGGDGRLVAFSVQNRAIAYPGEALTFGGVVTAKRPTHEGGLVDLDIFCRRGDDVLMPGTATVALPRRGTP